MRIAYQFFFLLNRFALAFHVVQGMIVFTNILKLTSYDCEKVCRYLLLLAHSIIHPSLWRLYLYFECRLQVWLVETWKYKITVIWLTLRIYIDVAFSIVLLSVFMKSFSILAVLTLKLYLQIVITRLILIQIIMSILCLL